MEYPSHYNNPLTAPEFTALLEPFHPFETGVAVAVATSGGADSMALCLLTDAWARARGGTATALIVDHGIRSDSAAEAQVVSKWLTDRNIPARILTRHGPPIYADIQAAARSARYELLTAWCRNHGVLHLFVGHNMGDQAETLLLRLGRGSGLVGLSAMAPLTYLADVRLLRPVLGIPRQRLEATATEFGQPWINDPSNRNPSFRRVRLRTEILPMIAAEGLSVPRLAATAHHLGRARLALERTVAATLSQAVTVNPAGFVRLDLCAFRDAAETMGEEIGLRALAAIVTSTGGALYPPRLDRLERLYHILAESLPLHGGYTLGGCRAIPQTDGSVVFCREASKIAGAIPLTPSLRCRWDGRFLIRTGPLTVNGLRLGAVGESGWRDIITQRNAVTIGRQLPAAVRTTLPAIFDHEGVLVVPHLGYTRPASLFGSGDPRLSEFCCVIYAPVRPMTVVMGPLVSLRQNTI